MGEEEVGVEQTSQIAPSLAGSPTTLEGCVGVSFKYPCLQARFVMERID